MVASSLIHQPPFTNSSRPARKQQEVFPQDFRIKIHHLCYPRTFIYKLPDGLLHGCALLLPPAVEKCRLHIDEPPVRILQQLIDHGVQDVLHARVLDVITI